MRRTLLVVGSLMLMAAMAFAQPNAGGTKRPHQGKKEGSAAVSATWKAGHPSSISAVSPDALKHALRLTLQQEKKFADTRAKQGAGRKADKEILAVLTPAQRKQAANVLKGGSEKHQKHPRHAAGRAAKPGATAEPGAPKMGAAPSAHPKKAGAAKPAGSPDHSKKVKTSRRSETVEGTRDCLL